MSMTQRNPILPIPSILLGCKWQHCHDLSTKRFQESHKCKLIPALLMVWVIFDDNFPTPQAQCLGRATFLVGKWLLAELWGRCGMSRCWKQRKTLSLKMKWDGARCKPKMTVDNQENPVNNESHVHLIARPRACMYVYSCARTHAHRQAHARTNTYARTHTEKTHPHTQHIKAIHRLLQ